MYVDLASGEQRCVWIVLRPTGFCCYYSNIRSIHSTAKAGGAVFSSGAATVEAVQATDPFVLVDALRGLSIAAVDQLDETGAEALVVACERVVAAVQARQSLALDVLARRVEDRLEEERRETERTCGRAAAWVPDAAHELPSRLAPALRTSTRSVERRLRLDRALASNFETTLRAAWDGDVERPRTDAVVEAGSALPMALHERFEALLLESSVDQVTGEQTWVSPRVREMCRSNLARRARQLADRLAPEIADLRAEQARASRCVVVRPATEPGLAQWEVVVPSETSLKMHSAVDALASSFARSRPGVSIDACRADALAALVLGNATITTTIELLVPVLPTWARACLGMKIGDGGAGGIQDSPRGAGQSFGLRFAGSAALAPTRALEQLGAATAVAATAVAATALKSMAAHDGAACPAGQLNWILPGVVDHPQHGMLLPGAVAGLLADPAVLIRLARLDPDGSIVQDPCVYRPSASMLRHIRARDGVCRFPGCNTPARRTDADHVLEFPVGRTTADNLICLCRTHHLFKHHSRWRPIPTPDGTVTWTAPDGRTYVTTPRPHDLLENLQLTRALDPTLGREWLPGLPPGMSLADLAVAEAAQPVSPPDHAAVPHPPADWADLDRAELDRAELDWAELDWADLDRADLDRADLDRADLDRADLDRADLDRPRIASTLATSEAYAHAHAHELSPLEQWCAEQLALAA
jgi:hypothetical protein